MSRDRKSGKLGKRSVTPARLDTRERAQAGKVPCVHWKECDGCPLIRFDYPTQLKKKFDRVLHAYLKHGFEERFLRGLMKATRPSPQTLGYRNKAKWILQADKNGQLHMGIYRRGTHEVADIAKCAVHAPEINVVSAFIKQELQARKVPCGAPDVVHPHPVLRYLIVRYSFRERKVLIVFVTNAEKVPGLDETVAALLAKHGKQIASVVQNINEGAGNVLLGEANRYLHKNGELTETMGRYRVPVGPLSFLQVNTKQAAYLYKRVSELLGGKPVKSPRTNGLDVYSGVGLFAMHMAPYTRNILAVEEVGPAALEGITACRRNRIPNILQYCGDALEGVAAFHGEWGAPHWVILNPPRKGVDESVISALMAKPPKRIAYVSCNPDTQARDLALIMKECPDYELRTLEPVDMFPQTDHVECIALLENRNFKTLPRDGFPAEELEPESKALN